MNEQDALWVVKAAEYTCNAQHYLTQMKQALKEKRMKDFNHASLKLNQSIAKWNVLRVAAFWLNRILQKIGCLKIRRIR